MLAQSIAWCRQVTSYYPKRFCPKSPTQKAILGHNDSCVESKCCGENTVPSRGCHDVLINCQLLILLSTVFIVTWKKTPVFALLSITGESMGPGWFPSQSNMYPDSKVHGPTWGLPGSDRTQVGPMFAPWTLLSGYTLDVILNLVKYMPDHGAETAVMPFTSLAVLW